MKLPPELQNVRRVAVFGMGKSGVAAVRLLRHLGIETHAVNEGPVSDWKGKDGLDKLVGPTFMHSQDQAEEAFTSAGFIVLSPGIPTSHPALARALARGIPLVSEIELAWWFSSHVPTVAVTGTNGKTTTTTMIAEALKLRGKKVFCGGNIGTPYSDMALACLKGEKPDYAVIEVSSFQLETIKRFHPKIGLILNLTPNHSERYTSVEDYGRAKLRLLTAMTGDDHLIIGHEAGPLVDWAGVHPVRKHPFGKVELPRDFLEKFDFTKGVLVGGHNRANYFCAWKTLQILGEADAASFQHFINTFPGVEHRLEYVGTFSGLKVYNDAKSTNGEATRTALAAFEKVEPLYLVVGGKLRNESDRLLPDLLPFKGKVTKIFTIGDTSERLHEELRGEFEVEIAQDLDRLFAQLREQRLTGNLVFSPAHPSFDQFKNYVDRGTQFKSKARALLG